MQRIQQLWNDLSRACSAVKEGESVLQRLATPPWNSNDPVVRAAWNALTHPRDLEDLLTRGEPELNTRARE
ncbi:MAG TPA: hypothetical protein DCR55_13790 [Lentisphaeria bacterium]|jgi:hypothetical protein|nr:hypothetical protein [Lentisphaeria bacterium]